MSKFATQEKTKKRNQRRILDTLASNPHGLRFKELLAYTRLSRAPLSSHLDELKNSKAIKKKGGRFGRYAITQKGKTELRKMNDWEISDDEVTEYPIDFEDDFGRNQRFTVSGLANFEFIGFPKEKVTSPIFEEEDEYIVVRVPKSQVENGEVAWFSYGIKRKRDESNGN